MKINVDLKYKSKKVNPGPFESILPEGASLTILPKLPMYEFKYKGLFYSITDIRFLNELAIDAFAQIICQINDGSIGMSGIKNEVSVWFPKEYDDRLPLIIDILMALKYEVKKKGRNGWSSSGALLCSSIGIEKSQWWAGDVEVNNTLKIEIRSDIVEYINDYYKYHDRKIIDYFDLSAYIANRCAMNFLDICNDIKEE